MFEKEAEEYACEYARQYLHNDGSGLTNSYCETYNGYYRGANDGYNKAKEEMQAQIEKMKSCSNCIHYSSTFGLCHYSMGAEDYDCRGRKWEIKEND